MTNLILKKFIKNDGDIKSESVRKEHGVLAGTVGIICNISLFIIKLIAGLVSGHISIVADAFNNLSDIGSCIVTLIGFKAVGKPADEKHPYGHGRTEYIAGQVVSFAIIFMGISLIRESVMKIIEPEESLFAAVAVVVLIISIAVKLWMWHFYRTIGKKLGSGTILATAKDSFNDVIATSVVLACLFIEAGTGVKLDGWAGVGVAVFVIISGIISFKETMEPLIGKMPSEETLNEIEKAVLYDNRILGVHDIIVHDYGPGQVYCTLHAEVPADMSLVRAHEAAHAAEKRVTNAVGCDVTIHIDPEDLDDLEAMELKKLVSDTVRSVNPSFKTHDFHLLKRAPNPKVSFDVVINEKASGDSDIVRERIEKAIKSQKPDLEMEITIDRMFVHDTKTIKTTL